MLRPCLIVIDFINDIVDEQGKTPNCAAYVQEQGIIEKANILIKLAREQGWLLIFVKVGFNPGYLETPKNSPIFGGAPGKGALKLGEWGTEFHSQLDYRQGDTVIVKPRVSVFYCTPLEAYLRAQHIDTLVLCGVSTNNAIQATARDGHDRDYQIIVARDACGAVNSLTHNNTLGLLEHFTTILPAEAVDKFLL